MQTTRQRYINATIPEALKAGMDCMQLKYDGWWCQMVLNDGVFVLNTQHDARHFMSGSTGMATTAVLVGEYMQGTQWSQNPVHKGVFYIFDLWGINGIDATEFPYRDRYALLGAILPQLPTWCVPVKNYSTSMWEDIWSAHVETGAFEGVVFRNTQSPVSAPLYRLKRDHEETYTCIGFIEGEGKHSGRLGALVINKKTDSGEWATVGGGFSDEERQDIWDNQTLFLNRQFDVTGKAKFASGLLRHPNFKRWKE